jgi:hypothetical protein
MASSSPYGSCGIGIYSLIKDQPEFAFILSGAEYMLYKQFTNVLAQNACVPTDIYKLEVSLSEVRAYVNSLLVYSGPLVEGAGKYYKGAVAVTYVNDTITNISFGPSTGLNTASKALTIDAGQAETVLDAISGQYTIDISYNLVFTNNPIITTTPINNVGFIKLTDISNTKFTASSYDGTGNPFGMIFNWNAIPTDISSIPVVVNTTTIDSGTITVPDGAPFTLIFNKIFNAPPAVTLTPIANYGWTAIGQLTNTSCYAVFTNSLPPGQTFNTCVLNWTAILKNNDPNGTNTLVDYGTSNTVFDGSQYISTIFFTQTFPSPPIVTATPIDGLCVMMIIETTNTYCRIVSAGDPGGGGSFAIVPTLFNWTAVLDMGSSGGNLANLKVDYGSLPMGANPTQVLFNIPFTSVPNIQLAELDRFNYIYIDAPTTTGFTIVVYDYFDQLPLYQFISWQAIL